MSVYSMGLGINAGHSSGNLDTRGRLPDPPPGPPDNVGGERPPELKKSARVDGKHGKQTDQHCTGGRGGGGIA